MWETGVQSLGREDPLKKGMATHSSILAWKISWTESLVGYSPWGNKESDTTEWLTLSLFKQQPTAMKQILGQQNCWGVLRIIYIWDKLEVTLGVRIKLLYVFSSTYKTIWARVSLILLWLFQWKEQFTLICAAFTQSNLKMSLWLWTRWFLSPSILAASNARDSYPNMCLHVHTYIRTEWSWKGETRW